MRFDFINEGGELPPSESPIQCSEINVWTSRFDTKSLKSNVQILLLALIKGNYLSITEILSLKIKASILKTTPSGACKGD